MRLPSPTLLPSLGSSDDSSRTANDRNGSKAAIREPAEFPVLQPRDYASIRVRPRAPEIREIGVSLHVERARCRVHRGLEAPAPPRVPLGLEHQLAQLETVLGEIERAVGEVHRPRQRRRADGPCQLDVGGQLTRALLDRDDQAQLARTRTLDAGRPDAGAIETGERVERTQVREILLQHVVDQPSAARRQQAARRRQQQLAEPLVGEGLVTGEVDLLEASTPELDDVVRLEDLYGRAGR